MLIAPDVPAPTAAPLRLLRPRARGLMRRELHEPFMPDPIRTRNNKRGAQSLFLSTELSTARASSDRFENHGAPYFQASFAARDTPRGLRLWKTMCIEWRVMNGK